MTYISLIRSLAICITDASIVFALRSQITKKIHLHEKIV